LDWPAALVFEKASIAEAAQVSPMNFIAPRPLSTPKPIFMLLALLVTALATGALAAIETEAINPKTNKAISIFFIIFPSLLS
jgi:hypothetical protein